MQKIKKEAEAKADSQDYIYEIQEFDNPEEAIDKIVVGNEPEARG